MGEAICNGKASKSGNPCQRPEDHLGLCGPRVPAFDDPPPGSMFARTTVDARGPVACTDLYDDAAKTTTVIGAYSLPKPTDDWCRKCGQQAGDLDADGHCLGCRVWTTPATVTVDATGFAAVITERDRAHKQVDELQCRLGSMLKERRNGPGAIRVKRLTATAIIPKRAHDGDSGLDLHADIDAPIHIMAGTTRLIPTGIAVAIPKGYEGQVRPRSGLAVKQSAAAFLGTIDSAYRGDVGVILHAHGPNSITVKPGDRIGQLVVAPVVLCDLVEVNDLDETGRGANGFGSSGVEAKS